MSVINPSPGYVLIKDKNTNKIGDFDMISDEKERESMIGEVIKCGDPEIVWGENGSLRGTHNKKDCPCKKGDIIIYPKYHSSSFTWEGEEYKIVQFEDVLAVIK
jgi:co-chaperonin GroES (HSP10)